MAKRKRKRRRASKMRPGTCRVITIKGRGKRKLCMPKGGGSPRFKKMSYKPR